MSFEFLNQLPTPADIKRDYPLSPELKTSTKKFQMNRVRRTLM